MKIFCPLLFVLLIPGLNLCNGQIVGSNGNDLMFFQGNTGTASATISNAYTGESFSYSGTYNVNNTSYDGLAGIDTLFMSNIGDVLTIRNGSGNQTLYNMEVIIAGNGPDVINLSDPSIVLGNITIDGGGDDDLIWGNSGADIIRGRAGNDLIDGGPGDDDLFGYIGINATTGLDNDILRGGDGMDLLNAGPGFNISFGDEGNDTFEFVTFSTIANDRFDLFYGGTGVDEIFFPDSIVTPTDLTISYLTNLTNPITGLLEPVGGYEIIVDFGDEMGFDKIHAAELEFLRFSDGSTMVIPEPSTYTLLVGIGCLGWVFWMRKRNAVA